MSFGEYLCQSKYSGQYDQSNREITFMNTFELCWKIVKNKKYHIQDPTNYEFSK